MKDAQQKWPFLTDFDCSTLATAGQLSAMVQTRAGITEEQSRHDVQVWLQGRYL